MLAAPFVPITLTTGCKAWNKKNKSSQQGKQIGEFYIFHALVITDEHQVDDEENKCEEKYGNPSMAIGAAVLSGLGEQAYHSSAGTK